MLFMINRRTQTNDGKETKEDDGRIQGIIVGSQVSGCADGSTAFSETGDLLRLHSIRKKHDDCYAYFRLRIYSFDAVIDYTIPPGWAVMVCPPAAHLNPENYKNPLEFNPLRWEKMGS